MMLKGGWDMVSLKGAYQNAFANWNYSQQLPYLGFNYNISDNTQWNFLVQMYGTKDMVNGVSTGRWSNMSWQGSRVMTEVKITF